MKLQHIDIYITIHWIKVKNRLPSSSLLSKRVFLQVRKNGSVKMDSQKWIRKNGSSKMDPQKWIRKNGSSKLNPQKWIPPLQDQFLHRLEKYFLFRV